MAAGINGSDGEGLNASINVTPLVDVMLVLLVIFMITAPMMQQGVDVELPKVSSGVMRSKEDPLVVSLKSDGAIFLGDKNEVPLESIGARVKGILDAQASAEGASEQAGLRKVFIKADRGLQYGDVMAVMGALHESGVTEVGLVTEPGSTPSSNEPEKTEGK